MSRWGLEKKNLGNCFKTEGIALALSIFSVQRNRCKDISKGFEKRGVTVDLIVETMDRRPSTSFASACRSAYNTMSQVAIVCGLLLILSRGPWTDRRGLLSFPLAVSKNGMSQEPCVMVFWSFCFLLDCKPPAPMSRVTPNSYYLTKIFSASKKVKVGKDSTPLDTSLLISYHVNRIVRNSYCKIIKRFRRR